MLLDPRDWSLAFRSDEVLADLPPDLRERVTLETHAAVMEVATGVHRRVARRGRRARRSCGDGVTRRWPSKGCAPPSPARTRPRCGDETVVSSHPRYRQIGESMRVLARREPTLATHVHVGVATPGAAVRLLNRLRSHLPLLLALSANSPFWQGNATRLRLDPHDAVGRVPALGRPAQLPRLLRLGRDRRRAAALGRDRRPSLPVVGRPPAAAARHRRGPDHGRARRRSTTSARSRRSCSRSRASSSSGPTRPGEESGSRCSRRTASSPPATACEALLIDVGTGARMPAIAQLERTLALCHRHARRLGCERELAASLRSRQPAAPRVSSRTARAATCDPVTASLARAYSPNLPMEVDHPYQPARRAA